MVAANGLRSRRLLVVGHTTSQPRSTPQCHQSRMVQSRVSRLRLHSENVPAPTTPIKSAKATSSLTPDRRHFIGRDPFLPRPRQSSSLMARFCPLEEPLNQSRSIHLDVRRFQQRQTSAGTVWNIRGLPPRISRVSAANDLRSSINIGTFTGYQQLPRELTSKEDLANYQDRVAFALDINQVGKILEFSHTPSLRPPPIAIKLIEPCDLGRTYWTGSEWINNAPRPLPAPKSRLLPSAPFKVLDAPFLRDDFYCSTLAYSPGENAFLRAEETTDHLCYNPPLIHYHASK
ncbi:hypothetical protein LMH87_009810 [Akanthomyces muscarius]|uniref:Uncharacterized protein n=1 Tax=Akanthomyces muscarius TaxID=2231603 RepID=A0A9W8QC37_AKAMU|nr:hypothetical protein LMH87_009810 [Akanthomyces muscarius]KAJ4153318.1 hypothetical protein LMH87_009810 [Akanthomyces muscarius]